MNITLFDAQIAGTALVQGLVALAFVGALWWMIDKFTHFNDSEEILVNQNWRYLTQRVGLVAAQVAGVMACFSYSGRWSSVGVMTLGSLWVMLVLLVLYPLIERSFGRKAKLQEAHMDNMGISLDKAAAYVAAGLVLNGSLSGAAPNTATAISATLVFTVLGLVALRVGVYVHNRGLKYDLVAEAREGKMPAAFELAGVLVALGILLRNAIAGDFVGWVPGLIAFEVTLGISLALLYIYRVVADKFIFSHCTVNGAQREEAVMPSAVLALILPVTALVVSMVVTPLVGILA